LLAIPISVALMCLSAKETQNPGSVQPSGVLRELVREKNILKCFIAFSLQWISLWMLSSFFVITLKAFFGLTVEAAVNIFFVLNASSVVFALPAGLLAPRWGLKKTIICGICIMAGCFLLAPFMKTYVSLIVCMIISGIGFGMVVAVSYPFLLHILPRGNTGSFAGIYHACQNGTLLAGPALAGFMIDHFGYVSLFYGCAGVMLASLIVYLTVRDAEYTKEI
jgi:maltose/moltooligosaccharide transporter